MIVTVTPNPSLDLTYRLAGPLAGPAEVHRAGAAGLEASGKGVNVSRTLALAGVPTLAVLPVGGPTGRILRDLLAADRVPHRAVEVAGETRVNTTVLQPGGVSSKLNGPGPALSAAEAGALVAAVRAALEQAGAAPGATWLAVCGSLPVGQGPALVAELVATAHKAGVRCAVDTSGPALAGASEADLLAPNRAELDQAVQALGPEGLGRMTTLMTTMTEPRRTATAAAALARRTGGELLVSMGPQGAVWTDGQQGRWGHGPRVAPVNEAGAGDALLAGWLADPAEAIDRRLVRAVAWGAAAALSPTTVTDAAAADRPSGFRSDRIPLDITD